jgi:hypothetical protein
MPREIYDEERQAETGSFRFGALLSSFALTIAPWSDYVRRQWCAPWWGAATQRDMTSVAPRPKERLTAFSTMRLPKPGGRFDQRHRTACQGQPNAGEGGSTV